MNISLSNNVNSQNNKNWHNSFRGEVVLFNNLYKTLSKEDYFALQKLRKQRKGKPGDVRIWAKRELSFEKNKLQEKKYFVGTVDQWQDMFVMRAAKETSKPNESLIDFIKKMCGIADKTKDSDYKMAW